MPRPLRIQYANAWYHVMDRGAAKQPIFHHDYQRVRFLELLGDITDRFKVEVHAYCLMDNHYHLLIHTPQPNLPRAMKHLNAVYAQYFNFMMERDGPLFRGRYKAIPVEKECYWLHLTRYIHRNPLEAGLVRRLDSYRWSSYRAYLGLVPAPEWLHVDYVLDALEGRRDRDHYRAFVETPAGEDMFVAHHWMTMLGSMAKSDHFTAETMGINQTP